MKTFAEWADDNKLILELDEKAKLLGDFYQMVQQRTIEDPLVKQFYKRYMADPEMFQGMKKIVAAARSAGSQGGSQANRMAQTMAAQQVAAQDQARRGLGPQ